MKNLFVQLIRLFNCKRATHKSELQKIHSVPHHEYLEWTEAERDSIYVIDTDVHSIKYIKI